MKTKKSGSEKAEEIDLKNDKMSGEKGKTSRERAKERESETQMAAKNH